MNCVVILQLYKRFRRVNYYTFLIEAHDKTEAEKFFNKFEGMKQMEEDLNELATWIQVIGDEYGAMPRYFRFENEAEALPPYIEKNNLRLYVCRLSEGVVVLANGGIKNGLRVQDCEELMPHFGFANKMAKQLRIMMGRGEIKIKGKEIINHEEIVLNI
ncbi:MAG: hypothetical protein MUC81_06485 [Bacteroidia bacterium]|nr:hypothetical protein [Bacteroidia bacterium]